MRVFVNKWVGGQTERHCRQCFFSSEKQTIVLIPKIDYYVATLKMRWPDVVAPISQPMVGRFLLSFRLAKVME